MPMHREDYPADWEDISHFIRFERAGGRCEWCGAPHGSLIVRNRHDPRCFDLLDDMEAEIAALEGALVIRVVLTTAHLPQATGTMDSRPEMLAALCQRCHLNLDRSRNLAARRANRDRKRGQMELEASEREMIT